MPAGHAVILLVDDVADMRHVARLALEAAGHLVVEAADGAEALEIAERIENRFDLLLTDVAMPRMDGATLAHHVAARLPHTPILFISANRSFRPPPGPRGRLGRFLPKPFRPAELVQAVEETLSGGQAAAMFGA